MNGIPILNSQSKRYRKIISKYPSETRVHRSCNVLRVVTELRCEIWREGLALIKKQFWFSNEESKMKRIGTKCKSRGKENKGFIYITVTVNVQICFNCHRYRCFSVKQVIGIPFRRLMVPEDQWHQRLRILQWVAYQNHLVFRGWGIWNNRKLSQAFSRPLWMMNRCCW